MIKELYETTAKNYEKRINNETTEWVRKKEKRLMKKYVKGLTLDVGCGSCPQKIPNSIRYDLSKEMIKLCKVKGEKVVVGRAEKLPFKQKFDSVTCLFTTLNLVKHEKAVKEFYKVLKPGGIVLVSVSSFADYKHMSLIRRLKEQKPKTKKIKIEGFKLKLHLFTKRELIDLFIKNGFTCLHFSSIFILQKPYWSWFRKFTNFEKLKLIIEQFFPFLSSTGHLYFVVFKKLDTKPER